MAWFWSTKNMLILSALLLCFGMRFRWHVFFTFPMSHLCRHHRSSFSTISLSTAWSSRWSYVHVAVAEVASDLGCAFAKQIAKALKKDETISLWVAFLAPPFCILSSLSGSCCWELIDSESVVGARVGRSQFYSFISVSYSGTRSSGEFLQNFALVCSLWWRMFLSRIWSMDRTAERYGRAYVPAVVRLLVHLPG